METYGKFIGISILFGICAVVFYTNFGITGHDLSKRESTKYLLDSAKGVLLTLRDFVTSFADFLLRYLTVAVTVCGIFASYAYVVCVGYIDARSLKNCMEKRFCFENKKTLIDRPELEKDLQGMLTPSAPSSTEDYYYYLITGEHGVGKTTAIKKTIQKIGGGVIYVEVGDSPAKFAEAFAEATGYKSRAIGLFEWLNVHVFKAGNSVFAEPWNAGNWDSVFTKFEKTAIWYKTKHHKLPVLIIDNVNVLAKQNSGMLVHLQLRAKLAVDSELFVMVFVSSDGMAPEQIRANTAISRGKLYHIGDINQDEVFEYLRKRGVPNTDGTLYSRTFELVGGRLIQLSNISGDLLKGRSFEDKKKELFGDIRNNIRKCCKTVEEKTILQAIFECINAKSVCSVEDVELYLENAVNTEKIEAIGDKLTLANVLSKVEETTWTFHANVVMSYFKEHPQLTAIDKLR